MEVFSDQPMKKKFKFNLKNNWYHLVIWVTVIIFFLFSPRLVGLISTKEGKPDFVNIDLPVSTDSFKLNVEKLELYDERGIIFVIRGWAFTTIDPGIPTNERLLEIVLVENNNNMVFGTRLEGRADVVRHFQDTNFNIQQPGFSALINKEVLHNGIYKIGFLSTNQLTGEKHFKLTNFEIIRTPNSVTLK